VETTEGTAEGLYDGLFVAVVVGLSEDL